MAGPIDQCWANTCHLSISFALFDQELFILKFIFQLHSQLVSLGIVRRCRSDERVRSGQKVHLMFGDHSSKLECNL